MATMSNPPATLDRRFSDPAAGPTSWSEAARLLEQAELFWLTTVRADGRPHVTPLIGLFADGGVYFCTGPEEQKARNLEANDRVALTTGDNRWNAGTDVVVEGTAVRVTDRAALERVAAGIEAKYGEAWHFDVGADGFDTAGHGVAHVFRIEPAKALVFAKDPHGQTTFRF